MFYLAAAVVLALAAALVVLALRQRPAARERVSQDRTVAALFQDRLQELDQELAGGQVAAEDRQLLEEELSAALLSDFHEDPGAGEEAGKTKAGGAGIAWAGALLVVVLSAGIYQQVGDPAGIRVRGAEAVLRLDHAADREALEEWRALLSERVDHRPDDAKSWYLLGHADLKLGNYATAAEAFATAHRSHGEDAGIDVYWLQARYMASGGQMDTLTREIAERVLARNPNQPLVLEMYALDAYRRGDFDESVSLLNRALSGNLAARHRQSLSAAYQEARDKLGTPGPAVDVVISTEQEVPNGATLFVIARPVGGGMPFAVVRRPAATLPRTVRLDDAVSMNPALPLSSAGSVEIVVRLSRAGTAMAHPGDWEWRSGALSMAAGGAPLELNAALAPPHG